MVHSEFSVNAFPSQQNQFKSCKISQKEQQPQKEGQNYFNIKFNSTCHSVQWLECELKGLCLPDPSGSLVPTCLSSGLSRIPAFNDADLFCTTWSANLSQLLHLFLNSSNKNKKSSTTAERRMIIWELLNDGFSVSIPSTEYLLGTFSILGGGDTVVNRPCNCVCGCVSEEW